MTSNSILEEIWAIKELLGVKASGDIHVFCEQARDWTANHLPQGIAVSSLSEVRALLADQEETTRLMLREEPPPYGAKADV